MLFRTLTLITLFLLMGLSTAQCLELQAGAAKVSITPLEEGIPTQLGGYGARNGELAHGIHDTIMAKVLMLKAGDQIVAWVTADICSTPIGLTQDAVAQAAIPGLRVENTLLAASHSHAGTEGFCMDRRNIANNPHIGIFSEAVLNFTSARIAKGLRQAYDALQPAYVASGAVNLAGFTANRRGDEFVDDDLTLLRVDSAAGDPIAVMVNFTAHGTIMTEKEMLLSGGWSGNMQRTVETVLGNGTACLYTNGAEGDIRPSNAQGGSRWEMAEDYGRRVGLHAAKLASELAPEPVTNFAFDSAWMEMPAKQPSPDFARIAGTEYGITDEQIVALIDVMWPNTAPLYALRLNDFQVVSFPGEGICQLGLGVKDALRKEGINYPCISGLTSEYIGYILTKEEYHESGYEVTASFYGDTLGSALLNQTTALGIAVARQ